MEHRDVEEERIVERYLRGELSFQEAARFEEHYLDCPECLQNLRLAERFSQALKGVAAQDIAAVGSPGPADFSAHGPRRTLPSWRAALAIAALLVLTAGLFLSWRHFSRLDEDLEQARIALDQERLELELQTQRLDSLSNQLEQERRDWASQRQRLTGELQTEQEKGTQLAMALSRSTSPRINADLLRLSPERSDPGQQSPAARLRFRDSETWALLSLELGRFDYPRYRAILRDGSGRRLWASDGLQMDENGAVTIALHSQFLPAADYRLEVQALPEEGQPIFLAAFPFRLLP